MNEASMSELGLLGLLDSTEDEAPNGDPSLAAPEAAPTALEQRDQEQVDALVDQVVTQYKQALRENRQRHAQEILEAAQREPRIAELLLPKLQMIEQMQRDMDTLQEEIVATFNTVQRMLDTFSQDRRNMHALNTQQAAALLEGFRQHATRINAAQDINSAANALIVLADWSETNLKPALSRTAQSLNGYFGGRVPQEINEEGRRLMSLSNTFVDTRAKAVAIRKSFDTV
jgi:uncharacterized protein YdiU (UPF0061 family)